MVVATGWAAAPATEPSADEQQAILRQLSPLMRELDRAAQMNELSQDSIKAKAADLIAKGQKAIELANQLAALDPAAENFAQHVARRFTAELAALGDTQTQQHIEKDTRSPDRDVAARAKAMQLHARWLKSDADSPERVKILDDAEALAKTDQANDALADTLSDMRSGRAKTEQRERMDSIVKENLPGTKVAARIREDEEATHRLASLEGQPIAITGLSLDGQNFSTEQWKGKVVLVDFWATWCGPCLQELPRVKKAYAEWHDKGLEVLGVSCDEKGKDLSEFLKKNPDMPWPQLFDPELAKVYGVRGIPTMFLIDKQGIVRSVKAREDFEQQIPKLLDE
jgi:thiol-disulfide isomerase/thioredoxin